MRIFIVKHIQEDQGPLSEFMSEIKNTPFSYTSKTNEANLAAEGNYIYVIEVRNEGGRRSYWLAYKYKAFEAFKRAGGALWLDQFIYKNSANPSVKAEGLFFHNPVRLSDPELCNWLTSKQPGMAELPSKLHAALELPFTVSRTLAEEYA